MRVNKRERGTVRVNERERERGIFLIKNLNKIMFFLALKNSAHL